MTYQRLSIAAIADIIQPSAEHHLHLFGIGGSSTVLALGLVQKCKHEDVRTEMVSLMKLWKVPCDLAI